MVGHGDKEMSCLKEQCGKNDGENEIMALERHIIIGDIVLGRGCGTATPGRTRSRGRRWTVVGLIYAIIATLRRI